MRTESTGDGLPVESPRNLHESDPYNCRYCGAEMWLHERCRLCGGCGQCCQCDDDREAPCGSVPDDTAGEETRRGRHDRVGGFGDSTVTGSGRDSRLGDRTPAVERRSSRIVPRIKRRSRRTRTAVAASPRRYARRGTLREVSIKRGYCLSWWTVQPRGVLNAVRPGEFVDLKGSDSTGGRCCLHDRAATGAPVGTAKAFWRVRTTCKGRAGCNPAPVAFLCGGDA